MATPMNALSYPSKFASTEEFAGAIHSLSLKIASGASTSEEEFEFLQYLIRYEFVFKATSALCQRAAENAEVWEKANGWKMSPRLPGLVEQARKVRPSASSVVGPGSHPKVDISVIAFLFNLMDPHVQRNEISLRVMGRIGTRCRFVLARSQEEQDQFQQNLASTGIYGGLKLLASLEDRPPSAKQACDRVQIMEYLSSINDPNLIERIVFLAAPDAEELLLEAEGLSIDPRSMPRRLIVYAAYLRQLGRREFAEVSSRMPRTFSLSLFRLATYGDMAKSRGEQEQVLREVQEILNVSCMEIDFLLNLCGPQSVVTWGQREIIGMKHSYRTASPSSVYPGGLAHDFLLREQASLEGRTAGHDHASSSPSTSYTRSIPRREPVNKGPRWGGPMGPLPNDIIEKIATGKASKFDKSTFRARIYEDFDFSCQIRYRLGHYSEHASRKFARLKAFCRDLDADLLKAIQPSLSPPLMDYIASVEAGLESENTLQHQIQLARYPFAGASRQVTEERRPGRDGGSMASAHRSIQYEADRERWCAAAVQDQIVDRAAGQPRPGPISRKLQSSPERAATAGGESSTATTTNLSLRKLALPDHQRAVQSSATTSASGQDSPVSRQRSRTSVTAGDTATLATQNPTGQQTTNMASGMQKTVERLERRNISQILGELHLGEAARDAGGNSPRSFSDDSLASLPDKRGEASGKAGGLVNKSSSQPGTRSGPKSSFSVGAQGTAGDNAASSTQRKKKRRSRTGVRPGASPMNPRPSSHSSGGASAAGGAQDLHDSTCQFDLDVD